MNIDKLKVKMYHDNDDFAYVLYLSDVEKLLIEKDKELSELKAKHKEDVEAFIDFIGKKIIKQPWFTFDVNGWYIPETSKHLTSKEFVDLYYTQTHGQ